MELRVWEIKENGIWGDCFHAWVPRDIVLLLTEISREGTDLEAPTQS